MGTELTAFLDSNIVLYAMGDDEIRKAQSLELLARGATISTQVVNHGQVIDGQLTLVNPFVESNAH